MATIQWRPEVNALTTPQSYRILFVPRNVASREDIAADIARRHPNFSEADILTILNAEDEAIQARLLNGEQVTKSGAFSYSLTFTGKLNSPDEPLPPLDDCLQVNVRVSPPFLAAIRQNAKTERLPMEKKLPLITTAADTLLKLNDVLNPDGDSHGQRRADLAGLCCDEPDHGLKEMLRNDYGGRMVDQAAGREPGGRLRTGIALSYESIPLIAASK
ncbi:MAG: hypothetical protein ACTFAK_16665 [Candidatus Electronema sp. VV]